MVGGRALTILRMSDGGRGGTLTILRMSDGGGYSLY